MLSVSSAFSSNMRGGELQASTNNDDDMNRENMFRQFD